MSRNGLLSITSEADAAVTVRHGQRWLCPGEGLSGKLWGMTWLWTSIIRPKPGMGRTHLEQARKLAAVEQDVLAGDVAAVLAAQKGAHRPEFHRVAEPPRRNLRAGLIAELVDIDLLGGGKTRCGWSEDGRCRTCPGRTLLIVTLCRATSRERPPTKPVSPARAPFDRPSRPTGAFTMWLVMLTIRPNLRSIMPSTVALMNMIGASHVGVQRLDPLVAAPGAEVPWRRTAGIVDQDIGRPDRPRARRRVPHRW